MGRDRLDLRAKTLMGSAWLGIALLAAPACAMELHLSGFASITGGKTFGGCNRDTTISEAYRGPCTRYVADWAHAGVYTPSFSFRPESKVGVQGIAELTPDFSATAQAVGRAMDGGLVDLDWAYLTYKPSPSWTLQAGRKRLPLYFFSDFQDVGYAYQWVRPPPELYGWDAVNYNGFNATYRNVVRGWSIKSNVFFGQEKSKKNQYSNLFYSDPKDVEWSGIKGIDLEINRAWFTTRFNYALSSYAQTDHNTQTPDLLLNGNTKGKQKFFGAAVNIDLDPWLGRSEYSLFDRSTFQYSAKSYTLGAGYRMGAFTPMITVSDYRESTPYPADYVPMRWSSWSFSLRYEVNKSSALKAQFDQIRDRNEEIPFAGNAKVISFSYDIVF